MDRQVTSVTIKSMLKLVTTKPGKLGWLCPTVVFSYEDLEAEICEWASGKWINDTSKEKLFIFGIHSTVRCYEKADVEEYNSFVTTCMELVEKGKLHINFVNYMHESGMSVKDSKVAVPCVENSSTYAFIRSWSEILSEAERQLGVWT